MTTDNEDSKKGRASRGLLATILALISVVNLFIFDGGQLNMVCSNAGPEPSRRKMRDNRHCDSVLTLSSVSHRPMSETTRILERYSSGERPLYNAP